MFPQIHAPGHQGLSDFTKLKGTVITIRGAVLAHLLYHFRLAYSGWCHVRVVQGGESFTALAEGLTEALERLGGVPAEHRTDSLAAAYRNLDPDTGNDITERYKALCRHYGMDASRNNRGRGHENGSIESPHGHVKRRIRQHLALRGSADFDSVADYQAFLNLGHDPDLPAQSRTHPRRARRTPTHTTFRFKIRDRLAPGPAKHLHL